MIITMPVTPLEKIYAHYGCKDALNIRLGRYYLVQKQQQNKGESKLSASHAIKF